VDTNLDFESLGARIESCRRCPRLIDWREKVAEERRASFANEEYWGKPVRGFGDSRASMMVVGLAPAAHGANRTGRIFTGDRSGDWLFASMYRCGLANQPTSAGRGDGLELKGVWVTAAVRCAPPANRPTPQERDNCASFLAQEMALLGRLKVVVALGGFAYQAVANMTGIERPRPRFGHGALARTPGGLSVVCSYHPSQQNTFTGRLTEAMLDSVFVEASRLAGVTDA
jgi:uracil-DNA glycosylase family 4